MYLMTFYIFPLCISIFHIGYYIGGKKCCSLAHWHSGSWALGLLGSQALRLSGSWAPGLLGSRALGLLGSLALGHLGSWGLGHLGFWTLGLLGSWALGLLGSRALGLSVSWALGLFGSWALGHLGSRTLGLLGTRALPPRSALCATLDSYDLKYFVFAQFRFVGKVSNIQTINGRVRGDQGQEGEIVAMLEVNREING
jgi:hypothetical protein